MKPNHQPPALNRYQAKPGNLCPAWQWTDDQARHTVADPNAPAPPPISPPWPVTKQVRVLPSGREFACEGSSTLLEAGDGVSEADMECLIINHVAIEPEKLADHDFYIAGNEALLDACRRVLINRGLPAEQLILDRLIHN